MKDQLEFTWPKPTALLGPQELYETHDARILQEAKENRRLERKPASIHASYLAEYLSMFANTKPDGGVIVIGMENDGTLSGCCALHHNHINALERAGDTHCPDARYEIRHQEIQKQDGSPDSLMLIRVHYRQDKVVRTNKGKAFVRRGESKTALSQEEIRELQLDKGEVDLELEHCATLSYPDAFDRELVAQFASEFRKSRGLETSHNDEEILELRHLGKREGGGFIPNVACVLLFAEDPTTVVPGCKMRFFRFEGEKEGSGKEFAPVKDVWIEGNIPTQIAQAEKVLSSQLRDFSKLGPDGKFYTASEYPPLAWYEALVNAAVHRSYGLRNMNVFIKMFDDRLVVESPGGFPGLVTPENIYDMHHPRNPHLMDAMFYLQFVRCAHEGTRRIRDSMAEDGLPSPEFRQKEVAHALVQVTLRNDIKQRKVWIDTDAIAIVGEALSKILSEDERRVINFTAENDIVNVSQVQRLTRRSWPYSKRLLEKLHKMGILHHQKREDLDRDPQAFYRLIRAEPEDEDGIQQDKSSVRRKPRR